MRTRWMRTRRSECESNPFARRPLAANLVVLMFLSAGSTAFGQPPPASVVTQGMTVTKPLRINGLTLVANGTDAVYTQAANLKNKGATLDGVAVNNPKPKNFAIGAKNFKGIGDTDDKFVNNVPQTHKYISATQAINPMTNDATTAAALARYAGTNVNQALGSNLFAAATVLNSGAQAPGGTAAAQAKDPMVYSVSTAGSFQFEFALGNPTIQIDPETGNPIPSLSFQSNIANAVNELDIAASITGVSYNGQTLSGDLFDLTISSTGILNSNADLSVVFTPNKALGLTSADIDAMDTYIQDSLLPLGGGLIGLAPGAVLPLFGEGSPIDSLTAFTLDYQAGTITYEDSLGVYGAAVPEPSSLILLSVGGLSVCATVMACRRRTSR